MAVERRRKDRECDLLFHYKIMRIWQGQFLKYIIQYTMMPKVLQCHSVANYVYSIVYIMLLGLQREAIADCIFQWIDIYADFPIIGIYVHKYRNVVQIKHYIIMSVISETRKNMKYFWIMDLKNKQTDK